MALGMILYFHLPRIKTLLISKQIAYHLAPDCVEVSRSNAIVTTWGRIHLKHLIDYSYSTKGRIFKINCYKDSLASMS